jgi:deoxyribose-phosphate aldolase
METIQELAKMIDHSLLHPTMTDKEIKLGCQLARSYEVATACVKPYSIQLAQECLRDSGVGVCAVIGFPHGNSSIKVKEYETRMACEDGATEIDMVVNIGKVLGEDWEYVEKEIGTVLSVTRSHGALLKVIFENDYLTEALYKIRLCEICTELSVDFVKTSTGYGFVKGQDGKFSYQGATASDLRLMRAHCGPAVQIKAAGGIRTLDELLGAKSLGVTRIGASATAAILDDAQKRFSGNPQQTGPISSDTNVGY